VDYCKMLIIMLTLVLLAPMVAKSQQQMDDVVYLKNGSIIRGMITEQIPNQTLKIQTKDGSVFVYNMSEVEKITKEAPLTPTLTPARSHHVAGYKSPAVAFVLSWLIPGAGQMYNGQTGKGILQLIASVGGYALFIIEHPRTEEVWVYHYESYYYGAWEDQDKGSAAIAYPALAVGLGFHIWSMIDAPTTASRMNANSDQAANELRIAKNVKLAYAPFSLSKGGLRGPNAKVIWRF
jgi:hypothetical protein